MPWVTPGLTICSTPSLWFPGVWADPVVLLHGKCSQEEVDHQAVMLLVREAYLALFFGRKVPILCSLCRQRCRQVIQISGQ